MVLLITDLSKYAFIILIALYTSLSYSVLRKRDQEEVRHGFRLQILNLFLIHALAFVVLYMQTGEIKLAVFYAFQFFLLQAHILFQPGDFLAQRGDSSCIFDGITQDIA